MTLHSTTVGVLRIHVISPVSHYFVRLCQQHDDRYMAIASRLGRLILAAAILRGFEELDFILLC